MPRRQVGLVEAVGKAALKTLGVGEIVAAIADFFLDEAGQKLGSEDLASELDDRLAPLFAYSRLDDEAKRRVAAAVSTTLRRAPDRTQLLLETRLDPARLQRALMDAAPADTWQPDEGERALYGRVMFEVASFTVETAPRLAGFPSQVARTLLETTADLPRQVEELRQRWEQAAAEGRAVAFTRAYRAAVRRDLDYVDLYGLDIRKAGGRVQQLSVAYISLCVAPRTGSARGEHGPWRQAAGSVADVTRPGERGPGVAGDGSTRLRIEDLLPWAPQLLIRGEAGSGKSTLLRWIALLAATEGIEAQPDGKVRDIPFLIRLRDFVSDGPPDYEDFLSKIKPLVLADPVPPGWIRACLDSGRAIVLVDGVDELPQMRRDEVRRWLKALLDDFKPVQVVVTSRPSAIEKEWLEQEGFVAAELQRMEREDIGRFIDQWHEAVRQQLMDPADRAALDPLPEQLKAEIRAKRPLRLLADLPLLCAALCALNRERLQDLPSNRLDLYRAFTEMLLWRREREYLLQFPNAPQLTPDQKRHLLQHLAYSMMAEGKTQIGRHEAAAWCDEVRADLAIRDDIGDVLAYLLERSGIIREPVPDDIDFLHRSLQEYLCALAVEDAGALDDLLARANDDQWREVIILMAGLANAGERQRLFSRLIRQGDRVKSRRHRLYLLAVACSETVAKLEQPIRDELDRCLGQIVPPRDDQEIKAIAAAGDLAVPHLHFRAKYDATMATACIRALAQIGGEAALDALKSYAHTRLSPEAIAALTEAAPVFEHVLQPGTYFRDVLAPLRLQRLQLRSITSLTGIESLTTLADLTIRECPQITDLGPLAGLAGLTSLTLSGMDGIQDLGPLAGLAGLTSLTLSSMNRITDLGPLAGLAGLTSLELRFMDGITDLGPLAGLAGLTSLSLEALPYVEDLEPLRQLPLVQDRGGTVLRLPLRISARVTDGAALV